MGPSFAILFLESYVTLHQTAEEESLLVNLSVFIPSCGCQCSVSLPCSAMSLSAVCDCGISQCYSLVLWVKSMQWDMGGVFQSNSVHPCKNTYSYIAVYPLSNERKSMFDSEDTCVLLTWLYTSKYKK